MEAKDVWDKTARAPRRRKLYLYSVHLREGAAKCQRKCTLRRALAMDVAFYLRIPA
jgi:hypothetical protein